MAAQVATPTLDRLRISETLKNYWVDILLFVAFVIDMNTHFTGFTNGWVSCLPD